MSQTLYYVLVCVGPTQYLRYTYTETLLFIWYLSFPMCPVFYVATLHLSHLKSSA